MVKTFIVIQSNIYTTIVVYSVVSLAISMKPNGIFTVTKSGCDLTRGMQSFDRSGLRGIDQLLQLVSY